MDGASREHERDEWATLERPLPAWFDRAKLGVYIHWGPYSVPAWAEPTGELGAVEERDWFFHNAYSEWYANTIRIDGSPAQAHHREVWGGRPYDDFLDLWQAEAFDPAAIAAEVAAAGADYLVLTTKHHDGVALWDAPGTGDRNAVHRGPRRDLVSAFADACRAAGLRFGTYYSGGLDWHVRPFPPHEVDPDRLDARPLDAEYASYAAAHLRDLIERYRPDILWNDINWPDAGKDFGPDGIGTVFREFYAAQPEGVVNDRWKVPHQDFVTSEYQYNSENEAAEAWENTRGIGLSFAYNQLEGPEHALSGPAAMRHLVDVATRGGRLLLGVGPMADGRLPDWQSQALREIGRWTSVVGDRLREVTADPEPVPAVSGAGAWVRSGVAPGSRLVFVDAEADGPAELEIELDAAPELLTPWAALAPGAGDRWRIVLAAGRPGPAVLSTPR